MATFTGSFRIRRGTSALWASSDPVGAAGELGEDTDLGRLKLMDGVKTWSALPWLTGPPLTHPISSGWTALNSGSVTADSNGRIVTSTQSGGTDTWKGETRTLSPTSNYTATVYLDSMITPNNTGSTGIILRNSGSGSFVSFGISYTNGWILATYNWTSATLFSATATTITPMAFPSWLRVRDDATNRIWEYSYNGVDWILHSSVTRTTFVTPDQIGWGADSNNATFTVSARLRHYTLV